MADAPITQLTPALPAETPLADVVTEDLFRVVGFTAYQDDTEYRLELKSRPDGWIELQMAGRTWLVKATALADVVVRLSKPLPK